MQQAIDLIELLAGGVGSRRPTSRNERMAALAVREQLLRRGVEARLEPFEGYASFGYPFGLISALATLPALLPAGARRARSGTALLAAALLASEGSLTFTPLSRLLSRRASANLVATIEPRGTVRRTLCLQCHLDTSRSGLIFDPRFVALLQPLIAAQAVGTLGQAAAELLLGGSRRGRRLADLLRIAPAVAGGLIAERELRGTDVPGANDNASGCAVAATLATEVAAAPLGSTRLVLLMTGCEESGTLGAQAFLRTHDTEGWLFVNFDNVGGSGSVRYLRREGVLAKWDADPGLIRAAERVAAADPGLRMAPTDSPAGLTYDASPVLARGGRAMTISVQDGFIPDLHWPTDTVENVDPDGVARTLAAGRALIAEIDAGGADQATAG